MDITGLRNQIETLLTTEDNFKKEVV
ncbi:MAG: hypothetical protein ACI8VW_001508 [bacterium]